MKTLKNILTATATALLLLTVQFSYAQSTAMKAPVSYQLKNGMTVIVAENSGTQKVFSTLSFEGENRYVAEKAAVQELVKTILTKQLPVLNQGLTFTDKGINLATTSDRFETAMAAMYAYVSAPAFTAPALAEAKSEVLAHIAAQDKYYPSSVSVSAIENLTIADVKAYYTELTTPATAFLTIAGNVKPSTIKAYANRGFNKLKQANTEPNTYLAANL